MNLSAGLGSGSLCSAAPLVPVLLEARSRLETWFAERARCLQIQCKLPRKQRAALMKVLVGDPLSAFRVHADGTACLVADLCGEDLFYGARAGVFSPVDMFYGRSLSRAGAAYDADGSGLGVRNVGPQEFRASPVSTLPAGFF